VVAELSLPIDDDSASDGPAALPELLRLQPAAVDAFYRAHFDDVYGFVHARLAGASGEVEDVVQDTFMTALARLHTFDRRSSLRTWLIGIAKHKAYERLRKRGRLHLGDEAERALAKLSSEDLPDALLENRELLQLASAALAALPLHYRSVLQEKYVDSRKLAEMALARGCTAKAVESLVQRARRAFTEAMTALLREPAGEA
jgi:RNA polymerase sigma-70 factor (ECF subfamily)